MKSQGIINSVITEESDSVEMQELSVSAALPKQSTISKSGGKQAVPELEQSKDKIEINLFKDEPSEVVEFEEAKKISNNPSSRRCSYSPANV